MSHTPTGDVQVDAQVVIDVLRQQLSDAQFAAAVATARAAQAEAKVAELQGQGASGDV